MSAMLLSPERASARSGWGDVIGLDEVVAGCPKAGRVGHVGGVVRVGGQYNEVGGPWEWLLADRPQHACKM